MSILKQKREATGLTQGELAALVGTQAPVISRFENGIRPISLSWARRIAPHVNAKVEELLPEAAGLDLPAIPATQVIDPKPYTPPSGQMMPVLGVAIGGNGGDFSLNGQVVEYVPVPEYLKGVSGPYALYVMGDSMYPVFRQGELIVVHPGRRPRASDRVVVQLKAVDGEPAEGYVKEFVRQTPTKLILKQFNPPKEIELDLTDIATVHMITGGRYI